MIELTDKRAKRYYGLIGIPSAILFLVATAILMNFYYETMPTSAWSYVIALSPLIFLFAWFHALLRLWRTGDELQIKIMKDGILIGLLVASVLSIGWALLTMFANIPSPNFVHFLPQFFCVIMLGTTVTQIRYRIKRGEGE